MYNNSCVQHFADFAMAVSQKKVTSGVINNECANCCVASNARGPKLLSCSRCQLVFYCGKECQVQHWKRGGHTRFCIAVAERQPNTAVIAETQRQGDECMICKEPNAPSNSSTLPCSHTFHKKCLDDLRSFGTLHSCPVCRASLPPSIPVS